MELQQLALLTAGLAAQHGHQGQQESEVQEAAQGQHHPKRAEQDRLIEGMAAASVGTTRHQGGPWLGIGQGREAGAQAPEGLQGQGQAHQQQGDADDGERQGPGIAPAPRRRPGRQQVQPNQQQLGQQPPLAVAVIEPATPAEAPAAPGGPGARGLGLGVVVVSCLLRQGSPVRPAPV